MIHRGMPNWRFLDDTLPQWDARRESGSLRSGGGVTHRALSPEKADRPQRRSTLPAMSLKTKFRGRHRIQQSILHEPVVGLSTVIGKKRSQSSTPPRTSPHLAVLQLEGEPLLQRGRVDVNTRVHGLTVLADSFRLPRPSFQVSTERGNSSSTFVA